MATVDLHALSTAEEADTRLSELIEKAREAGTLPELVNTLLDTAQAPGARWSERFAASALRILVHDLGEPQKAIDASHALSPTLQFDVQVAEAVADALEEREAWAQAVDLLERAARRCTDPRRRKAVYLRIGDLHRERLRQRQSALESYLVGFMCEPIEGPLMERLRTLYTALGKHKELAGLYDVLLDEAGLRQEDDATMARLWIEKARVHFLHLNDPDNAARSILRALAYRPTDTALLSLLKERVLPAIVDPSLRADSEAALTAPDTPAVSQVHSTESFGDHGTDKSLAQTTEASAHRMNTQSK